VATKYSINWENDEPVSFEIDGATYRTLDEVPNEKDRRKLAAMLDTPEETDEQFEREIAEFDREFEKDMQKARKNAAQGSRIVMGIFTGVALLMLAIAGIASFFNLQKLGSEASAPGRVVEVVSQRQYINEQDHVYEDYYYPVVEFTAADGRTRTVQMSEGSNPPSYETGEEVVVLYNPQKPIDARIQSTDSAVLMWILPGITGVLGLAFLVAVWVVRTLMASDEEE
jgi:flagellar basal body-associated protein FliL